MDIQALLDEIHIELQPHVGCGKVADYIPELAGVDPNQFGISFAALDGTSFGAGDWHKPFSIQSISKVLTLTLGLNFAGDRLWQNIGREPSGDPFNSIVQLEHEAGRPRNPFINAGALVVCDALVQGYGTRVPGAVLSFARELAHSDKPAIDERVAQSEARTGFRNRALANFMRDFGTITQDVDQVLDAYFCHCAIAMSCKDLARAASFLANAGADPLTGSQIIAPERCRRINALMLTCGHYDGSGEFAFRVGLPGKSGVGGGIIAIVPGHGAVSVWSPGLNDKGNSDLGTMALEMLARRTGWSVFEV